MCVKFKMLRCVKEIPTCEGLRDGDLVYRVGHDILPGGYECAVLRRPRDSRVFVVRQEALADHFETAEVGIDGSER